MKINKKLLLIILSLILATALAGGTTVSYLLAQTPPAENSFTPVFVDCKVEESFNDTTKSNVTVKNIGDIAAYIRATYVVMWVAADGSVHSARPVEGVDYSITFGPPSWNLGTDGFYYYDLPVSAGSSTEVLIDQLTILTTPPEGHKLVVHVAATAIQAEPAGAVEEAWGAKVHTNGALFAP